MTLTYHTYRLTVVYSTNLKPRYGSYASGLGLRSSNLDLLIKVPRAGGFDLGFANRRSRSLGHRART